MSQQTADEVNSICDRCDYKETLRSKEVYKGFELKYHTNTDELSLNDRERITSHILCIHPLDNRENYALFSEKDSSEILEEILGLVNLRDLKGIYDGIPYFLPTVIGNCVIHPHEEVFGLYTTYSGRVEPIHKYLKQIIDNLLQQFMH